MELPSWVREDKGPKVRSGMVRMGNIWPLIVANTQIYLIPLTLIESLDEVISWPLRLPVDQSLSIIIPYVHVYLFLNFFGVGAGILVELSLCYLLITACREEDSYLRTRTLPTAVVAQWVRALAPQVDGWVFKSIAKACFFLRWWWYWCWYGGALWLL